MTSDVPVLFEIPAPGGEVAAVPTPATLYGELFVDVQMGGVFADGKTFVDATPRSADPAAIREAYLDQRHLAGFRLKDFVEQWFELPAGAADNGRDDAWPVRRPNVLQRVHQLWPRLARDDSSLGAGRGPRGGDTRIALPYPYVVPGGRFREVYYWDSYFTMIGLLASGRTSLAEGMVRNFAWLLDRFGRVPNGSRTYFLGRSQPPFFFKMVEALARAQGRTHVWDAYLPQLRREYEFWMTGEDLVAPGQAHARVVRLKDGSVLNRYWDDAEGPREESWREDVETAARAPQRDPAQVYRDLRAGAESGWDFSSRWCAEPARLETIETTAILPIDLNALLWGLERAISVGLRSTGDIGGSEGFAQRAFARRAAIDRTLWAPDLGHYVDYHWLRGERRPGLTAAAVLPLFLGTACANQALLVAKAVRRELLAPNGLLTTTVQSGQQWDAPNGWAPLQYMAVEGLLRYGYDELARTIATRWIDSVNRVFLDTGKLLEKYDMSTDRSGGGGEYPTQDGFGWTNGCLIAMVQRFLSPASSWCSSAEAA